jgi:hypothetical protein
MAAIIPDVAKRPVTFISKTKAIIPNEALLKIIIEIVEINNLGISFPEDFSMGFQTKIFKTVIKLIAGINHHKTSKRVTIVSRL